MSTVKDRIYNARIPLLIVLTMLLTFALSLFMLKKQFSQFKEESVYYYNTIIEESIDRKIELSNNAESLFDKQAYSIMDSIARELKNVPLENIDLELLKLISKKYDITGLCILENRGTSATIKLSTVPGENGMSTADWGFWNTAIVELFNEQPVSVKKGLHIDNYWIGPKTYSSVEKEEQGSSSFYKYAYIKDPNSNYMISGIIDEKNYIMDEFNLNDLLSSYEKKIDFINSVFVIDLNRLRNTSVDREPFIIFGKDKLKLFPLISQKIKHSETDLTGTHSVKSDGKVYDFILNKLSNDRYIVTVMAGNDNFGGVLNTTVTLIAFFLFALYVVYSLIRKYTFQFKELLSVESKRSEVALSLSKTLSSVPDYVFKCKLDVDEIMLVFNEGSAISEESYIPIDSNPVPMIDYYPENFVLSLKKQILSGFKGERSQFEFKLSDKVYSFSTSPVYSDRDIVSEVMVTGIDVSSYIEDREKSRHMAYHDSLTVLPNRHMLKRDMSELISSDTSSTLYYLDLDGFKAVNDTLGHKRGDLLLKDVSQAISSSLHPEMKAYRFGGDEFIVLDSKIRPPEELEKFSKSLKQNVSALEQSLLEDIGLGVSIGIAIYPEHGDSEEALLSKADQAMYLSKKDKSRLYTISF